MTSTAILPITAPNTVVPAVCVLLEPLREDRLTTYALLKDLQCSWLQILLLPTLAILFDNLGVAAWVAAWVAVQVDALGINSRDWVSTALFTFLGWILITCGGLARIITGLGWQREKNRAQLVYQITDIEELEKLFLTRLGEAGLPESLTLQTDDAWIDLSQGRNRPVVLGLLLR
ncbi:hypothetical protein VKT23_005129 [Stygiomarasmius scandens]|uniref:Uncharacterized protein n=1 Tax=Marasmiellus scandens TaxID=2682957 RepID=A0ABR1JSE1_9AGAR